jgi:ATP-dependent RNA helicase DeaD
MDFTDLGLESIWSPALATQGIDVPTTIQQRAIPLILQGLDTYVGAETGTGKTLAYLLPLMQRLDASTKSLQVVVLAPTLELALQTHRQAQALGAAAGGTLRSQALIGGVSYRRQLEQLKKTTHSLSDTGTRHGVDRPG